MLQCGCFIILKYCFDELCAKTILIVSIATFHSLFYIPVRTRVPQMASSVSQRRTGTVLPPPGDDFSYSAVVSAKHTFKNGTLVCSLSENSKCIGRHAIFLNLMLLSSLGLIADIFIMFWLTYSINWPPSVQNATNQPRLSPPNSSSGRSTLPPAASWYGISKSLLLPFCYALKLRTVLLIFFPFLCAGGSVI